MSFEPVRMTQDEMVRELTRRFGPSPNNWAFQCPICNDVATGADWKSALIEAGLTGPDDGPDDEAPNAADYLGQECIGRVLGALRGTVEDGQKYKGRGCDWCAYGLFRGPWFIILPDGREVGSFPIAPELNLVSEAVVEVSDGETG
jgi:hypothetical protein